MRTLDPILLSAMDAVNYTPYFSLEILDKITGATRLLTQPLGYELKELELVVTVQVQDFMDLPFYRTVVVLTRGITVGTLHYTISTSEFFIINSTWDGNFQTFHCHLIPRSYYTAAGDVTYSDVITTFCEYFGKTAVFLEPAADWLDWQFLPTGKILTLNNAQQLFTMLKQKYFIFACDNAANEILFYTPFSHVKDPQYEIDGYHFAVDYNVDQKRQYLWRDEFETVHTTVPSFEEVGQPDAAVSYIMSLLDLGHGRVLCGSYQSNHGYIYRSTDYGSTWATVYNTTHSSVYALATPAPGVVLACGGQSGYIARSTDYGQTWTNVQDLGNDATMCLADCGNGIVLASHTSPAGTPGAQIYKSTDYGLTWSLVQALGAETNCEALIYLGGGVALAGTRPNGRIYRSTDYGSSWSLIQQLGAEQAVLSLLAIEEDQVLAGTYPYGKIYKSTDAGLSWTEKLNIRGGSGSSFDVFTLNTLGRGILLAGIANTGFVYRSMDYGETWAPLQQLGAETQVRSFITLGNGATLAGTGTHAYIYRSLNCAADADIVHNLGFLPSEAVEPSAYFQLAPPAFDPFPVHLKYQSSDYIRINLPDMKIDPGVPPTYDLTCAQVSEVLDLSKKAMPWRILLTSAQWLTNTAGGPLPSTIEAASPYTPLNTSHFDKILSARDNNLQAAMETLDEHQHTREILTADRDYYVRTDGDDAHSGLHNTTASAFLTISKAMDVVYNELDISDFTVTVHVAAGTYTNAVSIKGPNPGSGKIYLLGDTTTPSNVVISTAATCIAVDQGGIIHLGGFKLTTSSGNLLGVLSGSEIDIDYPMVYGTVPNSNYHFSVIRSSRVYINANYEIAGNCSSHIKLENNAILVCANKTITLTGTPNWAGEGFLYSRLASTCNIQGNTYTGAATGRRFYLELGSGTYINGAGLTYFPGNAAGLLLTGAAYDLDQELAGAAANLGFYGTVPVAQPAANADTTISAAGGTNTVYRNTTFTGGAGASAYSIGGIVKALKALGLIAP